MLLSEQQLTEYDEISELGFDNDNRTQKNP